MTDVNVRRHSRRSAGAWLVSYLGQSLQGLLSCTPGARCARASFAICIVLSILSGGRTEARAGVLDKPFKVFWNTVVVTVVTEVGPFPFKVVKSTAEGAVKGFIKPFAQLGKDDSDSAKADSTAANSNARSSDVKVVCRSRIDSLHVWLETEPAGSPLWWRVFRCWSATAYACSTGMGWKEADEAQKALETYLESIRESGAAGAVGLTGMEARGPYAAYADTPCARFDISQKVLNSASQAPLGDRMSVRFVRRSYHPLGHRFCRGLFPRRPAGITFRLA